LGVTVHDPQLVPPKLTLVPAGGLTNDIVEMPPTAGLIEAAGVKLVSLTVIVVVVANTVPVMLVSLNDIVNVCAPSVTMSSVAVIVNEPAPVLVTTVPFTALKSASTVVM
jgi:hypothetical protein